MSYWKEKCKIGNLEVPRFFGAPLDGVTDSPFRKLVREFSQEELLYTEMRHVACVANEKGAKKSVTFDSIERPLNYQFAANKIDFIEKACDRVLEKGVDCIDLNIGCPARNIVSSGSGSALMGDIDRLKEILINFRARIKCIPFTVKIRAGFKSQNALDVAKLAQDCGADAIAIHPRLQTQKFGGTPDYALAGKIKKVATVPVFISGGINDFSDAKHVYAQTGADGYLIGRGMWAKPWKLKEMKEHALGNEYQVDKTVILKCALAHLDNVIDFYGTDGIFCFRKHLSLYIKGLPFAAKLREELMTTDSVTKTKEGLIKFLGS